jgi:hypothetical protein
MEESNFVTKGHITAGSWLEPATNNPPITVSKALLSLVHCMFQELIVITSLEPVVIGIFSRDCSKNHV